MEIINQGEARIIFDVFEDSINRNRLHREGYRLYLWNQYRAMCKKYQVRSNDEMEDMNGYVGTRQEFDEYLLNLKN